MKPPIKKFIYKLDTVFNFGKHRGETVKEVIQSDPSYIQWCMDEIENFEMDDITYNLWNTTMEIKEGQFDRDYFGDSLF